MSAIEGALEHAEETSKLYRETTVKIKQPAGGYLRVSKHLKIVFTRLVFEQDGIWLW